MRLRLPAIAASCLLLTALASGVAGAAPFFPALRQQAVSSDRPYFVDFRADARSLTGHTYLVYGRLDSRGHLLAMQNADVYPEDHDLGTVVGTFAPVRASVRVREGESKRHHTISYLRYLTADEYSRMLAAIRHERMVDRQWSLLLFNCNDFASNIAKSLGLRRPSSLMLSATYVASLRLLNGRSSSAR